MRTVRRFALVVLLASAAPLAANAQTSFRFTPSSTTMQVDEPGFVQFHGELENLSESQDVYILTRTSNAIPEAWSSSICTHHACSPPFISEAPDTLGAGEIDEYFSLDVSAESEGTGTITLRIVSTNDPADSVVVNFTVTVGATSVEDGAVAQPAQFSLEPVYPNPFNSTSRIEFALPHAAKVQLQVFTVTGRLVGTLADGVLPAGRHARVFQAGETLASGTYLVRLHAADKTLIQRAVLVR